MKVLSAIVVASSIFASAQVQAHLEITYPPERAGTNSVGGVPCGTHATPGRGPARKLLPGSTVEVRWTETIDHPGHFRISFDADGQDDFVDPASYTDFYTAESVLLDDIPDNVGGGNYSASIVLPDIECDNCTLQMVQVNTDKPPFTSGEASNDIHRTCADITLTPDAEILLVDGFE